MKKTNLVYLLAGLILAGCSGSTDVGQSGFGVWSEDCTQMAVAVNHWGWSGGFLTNNEDNERYDLHICDSLGSIRKTLFSKRNVEGIDATITALVFDSSGTKITVYSQLMGTVDDRVEVLDIATGTIESSETRTVGSKESQLNTTQCNGKSIVWDFDSNWVVVEVGG
jgi:hypothetical protein